jgi:hypothetical protein
MKCLIYESDDESDEQNIDDLPVGIEEQYIANMKIISELITANN